MKKIILFSLITITVGFSQFVKAQTALSGTSVITTGTKLGWRGTSAAAGHTVNGVINKYYKVTAFTPASGGTCTTPATLASLTVGTAYGAGSPALAAGMEVLIIQMTASTSTGVIDRTNTSSYGTYSNAGGAGNYEFAIISAVTGSTVTFTTQLVNTYDPLNANVQLIPTNAEGTVAPNAANYATSNTLRAMEYDIVNGVGGVFVLSTTGTLTLSHDINVDTLGFPGADTLGAPSGSGNNKYVQLSCCVNVGANADPMDAASKTSYFLSLNLTDGRYDDITGPNQPCSLSTGYQILKGSRKGWGIFGVYSGEELGKGNVANGGGGAHGFNSGGAGGGGYAGGGNGGYENSYSCDGATPSNLDNGGRGGVGINGGTTAVFMGGGGGAGQGDGSSSSFDAVYKGPSKGGDGGGIIIIKANQITGNSHVISANGMTARKGVQDGSGGGGGGGSILLEVTTYSGTLSVTANGGNGGDAIQSTVCHGTGGGGGGGLITFSGGAPGGAVTQSASSGTSGNVVQNSSGYPVRASTCLTGVGITYGAAAGTTGTVSTGTINTMICSTPSPVTLMNFYVELINNSDVGVYWQTATEINSSYFVIERSSDGVNFEEVGIVQAHGNSQQMISYSFQDEAVTYSGTVYYRLRMVDIDGSFEYSKIRGVVLKGSVVSVYPNPVKETSELNVTYFSYIEDEEITVSIVNILGKICYSKMVNLEKGTNKITLSTQGLSAGIYFLEVNGKYGKTAQKVIIE